MIRVFDDPEALSRGAAELFVSTARDAVAARGRCSMALSGGRTPRRTYELLAQPAFRDRLPWAQSHVFWGDERCVEPEDPRSNARLARETLLNHVPLPAGQVYPMLCNPTPAAGARSYEALLRDFFGAGAPRFDLILLGLGENGHTASLFPGDPVLSEPKRWVAAVYVAEQDMYRLTLTAAIINQARVVAFLVAGAAKAAVVQEVRQGLRDPRRLPAQLIQPERGELHWLLDQRAAGGLPRHPAAQV
ncbi:MAG: 6-phosphogluconolactonase [Desulfobaccales bacterium]